MNYNRTELLPDEDTLFWYQESVCDWWYILGIAIPFQQYFSLVERCSSSRPNPFYLSVRHRLMRRWIATAVKIGWRKLKPKKYFQHSGNIQVYMTEGHFSANFLFCWTLEILIRWTNKQCKNKWKAMQRRSIVGYIIQRRCNLEKMLFIDLHVKTFLDKQKLVGNNYLLHRGFPHM